MQYQIFSPVYRFGLGVFMLIFLFTASGCEKEEILIEKEMDPTAKEQNDIEKIRFLYSDWPPDLIAYLAQEKGFFEKYNVLVELVQVAGYDELLEKKADKKMNFVWSFTLLDVVKEYSTGEEPGSQILLVEDYSAGADAVLATAKSGIKTIADLKGKKVGVESETVGEFFLNILLQRENLTLNDLEKINLSSEEIPAALAKGEIDAGVAYEPDVSTALGQGAVLITDSSRERGVIVDVYVGNREHIQANKQSYSHFAKAIFEAADYYNQNQKESIQIMAQAFNTDIKELSDTFNNLEIADLRDNQIAFNRSSGFNSLYNLAKQAEQFLEEQGVIKTPADYDLLLGNSVIDSI